MLFHLEGQDDQTDEHVDEEEGEDDHKDDEVDGDPDLVVKQWSLIHLLTVDPCLHNTVVVVVVVCCYCCRWYKESKINMRHQYEFSLVVKNEMKFQGV